MITQIDLLVQYDEYRMPKEGNMPDNEDPAEQQEPDDDY